MNSRLTFNNSAELGQLLAQHNVITDRNVERKLIIVQSAPNGWLKDIAFEKHWDYLQVQPTTDRSDQIAAVLGSERWLAILELERIPDLGLTAALAGTIKAGGTLVLGIPATIETSASRDTNTSFSLIRLVRLVRAMAISHPGQFLLFDFVPNSADTATLAFEPGANPVETHSADRSVYALSQREALDEQNNLLSIACRELLAPGRCCIVIKGQRGRGKSTLMARIATELADAGVSVKFTAKHPTGLHAYRRQTGHVGQYISPESAAQSTIDTLMVDEAACFSISHLQHYARVCRKLVLTSTVDGYEAAGRALDLRLFDSDSSAMERIRVIRPVTPWRWAKGDPLETFINKLLLSPIGAGTTVSAPTGASNNKPAYQTSNCKPRKVHRQEFSSNETLLKQVHSLLLATHYQSGTKDLEHLLDAPSIEVWVQQHETDVVGVLMLEFEGSIDSDMHDAILARQRRLPNNLLPQLLAQTADCKIALGDRYARILRIAILPGLRRAGLATALLQKTLIDINAIHQTESTESTESTEMEPVLPMIRARENSGKVRALQNFTVALETTRERVSRQLRC